MDTDDLEKRMKETLETLEILEENEKKLTKSLIRMYYCFLAITIITLFLHLGSEFYKEFPFDYLYRIMVSATLGSYTARLIFDIRSERKRFCSLDILKKMII